MTRLLKDSIGGNFKTTLIVTCSPHCFNFEETVSSLNFAKRAKKIKNKVKVNIKRNPEELENIILGLQGKLKIANELLNNRVSKEIKNDSSKDLSNLFKNNFKIENMIKKSSFDVKIYIFK